MNKIDEIFDELIKEAKEESSWTAESALRCAKKELLSQFDFFGKWISVKDRLPKEDVYVLAHNGVASFIAAYTTNPSKRWYAISGFTILPAHWMPLPSTEGLNGT